MGITRLKWRMLHDRRVQRQIAADADIDPSDLSKYALAHKVISPDHLHRLSVALECDPEELLGVVGDSDGNDGEIVY